MICNYRLRQIHATEFSSVTHLDKIEIILKLIKMSYKKNIDINFNLPAS